MEIEVQNLWFSYDGLLQGERAVLKGISFRIAEGEVVGVVGPSGSGKTTLLLHFTGLLRPQRGKVQADGIDVHAPGVDLASLRRRIGLVFQFPEVQLFEETVWKDVAFAAKNLGLPPEEIDRRVHTALELVGLEPSRFGPCNPHLLSEGQRRRVAIAGVLVMDPEVLVLDEPTAGLDAEGVRAVETLVHRFRTMGRTVVLVSHHLDFVARNCPRLLALSQGELIFDGTREAFFEDQKLLQSLGFELPRLLRWWQDKRRQYPQLPPSIYSLDELRSALGVAGAARETPDPASSAYPALYGAIAHGVPFRS
ncbi:MAG: energy-coupling factor ABC transporter ATP-binding protein [candidate division KSB1 bacterium]|nr:energy-coupling factor ABC transporter ATP-binding protein [candidate division KSB1 bacterium]